MTVLLVERTNILCSTARDMPGGSYFSFSRAARQCYQYRQLSSSETTGCITIKTSVQAVPRVCSTGSQEIRDHFPGICVYVSLMAALKFTYFCISMNNVLLILIGVMFISYNC